MLTIEVSLFALTRRSQCLCGSEAKKKKKIETSLLELIIQITKANFLRPWTRDKITMICQLFLSQSYDCPTF